MVIELITGEKYTPKNINSLKELKKLLKKEFIEIIHDINSTYICAPAECITPENRHLYTGQYIL